MMKITIHIEHDTIEQEFSENSYNRVYPSSNPFILVKKKKICNASYDDSEVWYKVSKSRG